MKYKVRVIWANGDISEYPAKDKNDAEWIELHMYRANGNQINYIALLPIYDPKNDITRAVYIEGGR